MDYRLTYTQRALSDLAQIIGHLAEDDAVTAERFGNGLLDHIGLLVRFPRMGSLVRRRPKVRKLAHSPILVYYRVHDGRRLIEILHIRHGARKQSKFELPS